MDKYDKHLQFLQLALPFSEQLCTDIFVKKSKRDVRKALFFLLQPEASIEQILQDLKQKDNVHDQIECLQLILHCYCPNASYSAVLRKASKGLPIKLDTVSLKKLKQFRRAPRKEVFQHIFNCLNGADATVILFLLCGIRPFGRELVPFLDTINAYANGSDTSVIKAALQVLSQIPQGIQNSIVTFARYSTHPELSMTALKEMQSVYDLPGQLLIQLFSPLIDAYRQRIPAQGTMNDWWPEFRLLRQVLYNNGVVLNLPEIQLGKF
jgi:hypothetical protein